MKGLRILLYANVDAAHAGGVQAVVRGLAQHLAKSGHRVSTGWAERSGPGGDSADGWAEAFHVRRGAGRWLHLRTLGRLARRLLRERPQVVNVHFASPSTLYFLALAPWLGFRVVLTCHGSDILRSLPDDAPFLPRVIEGADGVTVVSADIAARIDALDLHPRRAPLVIANGVDTGFWQPPASRLAAGATPTLMAVGRIEPVKGFDLLIEACGLLALRGSPARLVIVGEGSQQAALAAQAEALGIADAVHFAGRLPPSEIRAHLHSADLFVLPSRSEGMPLALMEAMASGTPAVAADVGGVARTAAGAARLVPPEDPAALTEALAALLADPTERDALSRQGVARALDFSVAGAHAAYEALMLELAALPRA